MSTAGILDRAVLSRFDLERGIPRDTGKVREIISRLDRPAQVMEAQLPWKQ